MVDVKIPRTVHKVLANLNSVIPQEDLSIAYANVSRVTKEDQENGDQKMKVTGQK